MTKGNLKKDLLLISLFGGLAALVNLFRLPLFFEAEYVFGPFLVLLIAVFRGPMAGFLASVIASIPLVYAWGSFWPTLTFGLEALFVGYVYSLRRFNVILIVIAYWMLIGMPISWYSISQYELFLDSHRTSILIKQLTNAILYAHITVLLMYLPFIRKLLSQNKTIFTVSIKEHSSHLISSLLITLGILFFFINLVQNTSYFSEKFEQAHSTVHEKLIVKVNSIIDRNSTALNEFKFALTDVWFTDSSRGKKLLEFHHRQSDFKTMIIANTNADLLNSSPPELVNNIKAQGEVMNVKDRDYFYHAIDSDQVFISPGFVGRGFGNDLIVAMSVGVPNSDSGLPNIGVVEGSIYLRTMNEIISSVNLQDSNIDKVITDQNNNVLFATDRLNLTIMQNLSMSKGVDNFYDHNLVSIYLNGDKIGDVDYFINETQLDSGWKVVTLQDESYFAGIIEKNLIYFSISIVLVVLLSKLLAWAISRSWSYYMHRLNKLIDQGADFSGELKEFEGNENLPFEISNLYQEIKSSRLEILKMNKGLQQKVAERTDKLQKANAKLNNIVRKDALTQLENRYVFNELMKSIWSDCQQNLLPMSMLIIDIDHFKAINDNYGHPIGDKVLTQIAAELSPFKTDAVECLARIGGEEFCLLLKGLAHDEVTALAEKIRVHVENINFLIGSDKQTNITVSAGVATIDATKFTPTKLYQLADNALYEAKNAGRNQVKSIELV